MTEIGFYNGLKEIGGTFVVVETERACCMFDFGFAVADRMDPKIRIRKRFCAADHVRLGALAPADGIYEKETAEQLGLKAFGETEKTCFFVISHMHIDHMGGLGMLHPDIPVYMSSDSLTLYRRLSINGETEVRPHKNCIGVPFGGSFTVEDLVVKVIPVDHDVAGACGYLIETPDGVIAYTGDYRFHGFHPEVTEAFAGAAKGADVLITEGVTVSDMDVDMRSLTEPEEGIRTEADLQEEMKLLACKEEGLIVINPYNRNVERLHRLLHTLKAAGRTLVMDGVQADYVAAFYPEDELFVYEETAESWRPCEKLLVGQEECRAMAPRCGEAGAAQRADRRLVSKSELLADPQNYVLQLDYGDMYELMDLKQAVTRYVHMDGSPLGAYDLSFGKMHALLELLGIPCDHRGIGGHARPYYLKKMADTVAPGTLIPLHSFRPEQVDSDRAGQRILPEYGEWYGLTNGNVKPAGERKRLVTREKRLYENTGCK